MGLEDVKNEILKDAEKEAEEIKEEGEKKAEEIKEEAKSEAEKIKQKAEQNIEKEKKSIRNKEISNARMQARERKLEVKERELKNIFESFREKLQNLDEEEKEDLFKSTLGKTGFEVGKVYGSNDFKKIIDSEDLEFEEIEENGLILESENSERRMNFTFDKIVEDMRKQCRQKVAEITFEA